MLLGIKSRNSRTIGVIFTVLALAAYLFPNTAANAATKDFNIPATYVLTKCQSEVELDCIESVGIVDLGGRLIPGVMVSEKVSETPRPYLGNAIYDGSSDWVADAKEIKIFGSLDSPKSFGCLQTCAALRIHVEVANPLTTRVHLKFRTSWLRPMNVQFKAADSDYKYEKIPGGASWTMVGVGMPYSRYQFQDIAELNAKKSANAKSDLDSTLFDIYIHHAGLNLQDSFWDPKCSDKGFSVQSHNTDETGDPMWDAKNESLIFSIFAPHLKASGDLNTGYFKYWASHEFMDCKYPGNTLTKSARLIIEIENDDGTRNVATTAVTNRDGTLNFFAVGFHFSSPKILIKSAPPALTLVKQSTISCVKGKLTKKVFGVNPKCPTGYKKK